MFIISTKNLHDLKTKLSSNINLNTDHSLKHELSIQLRTELILAMKKKRLRHPWKN